MEHDSDDDVLILYDETCDQVTAETSNDDLFRQIDEHLAEEPQAKSVNTTPILSRPAAPHCRPKRAFALVQAPTVASVEPNVTITPMVAGASQLNEGLINRLGPIVIPMSSRLGPPVPSTSSTPDVEPKPKRPRGPDRRPEVYKALTQQGIATLNLPELVRPAENRPFFMASQYNRNEQLWRELTHKDRTAREFSEWHLHLQTPRYMPTISFKTARSLIDVTYKVVPNHKLAVYEFYEGQKVKDTDVRITAFEAEVRQCGFMSFDTEGGGSLPRQSGETKDDKRIFIAMSSPKSGSVLLFHCMNDVPDILLKLLSDYVVAKIQSNIAADVKILDDAGYDVRGLVDSGVLYTFISPGTVEEGFGAKRQNQVLWPGSDHYVPYEWRAFNPAYRRQKLTERARRHVVQDVILPYAILFEAACMRVIGDGKSQADVFPYINELLELAYTREPTFVRAKEPKDSARDYWLPPISGNEYDLNSKSDCSLIRRARAAYIENYDGPTLQERKRSAEAIWQTRELPSTRNKSFRVSNWALVLIQYCTNCGDELHKTLDCPTPMVPCAVPHYPGVTWQTHSVLCCPQLHSRCTICRMRGHIDQQHPLLEQTPREFRENFWRYCHLGLYTSLPYLYETNGPLKAHHWKATMMQNRQPRGLGDLWLYKGLEYRFAQMYIDQVEPARQTVTGNLFSTIHTYKRLLGSDPEDGSQE